MTDYDVAKHLHASQHATGGDDVLTPANIGAVPTTRKVNNKALSGDITLTAADVTAAALATAAGASAITGFAGYAATLPSSGSLGQVFFLQAP
jgi:hypothetical protein